MKFSLKEYKKIKPKTMTHLSAYVTVEQQKFIEDSKINFSALVRDVIDSLIKQNKGEK
jgi:hypothetical protein